jgi:toxin-antitoxin system PIN domain toxin
MSKFLLDVNVLIALVTEGHIAHRKVTRWFRQQGGRHWATCPLTEAGFVRVVANPKFSESTIDMSEAMEMLGLLTQREGHEFLPVETGFLEAVKPFAEEMFGHQQVTDGYLLGVALKAKAVLVTLDGGIKSLAGNEFSEAVFVIE